MLRRVLRLLNSPVTTDRVSPSSSIASPCLSSGRLKFRNGSGRGSIQAFAVFSTLIIGLSGCASVRLNTQGQANHKSATAISHERVALASASNALASKPWPAIAGRNASAKLVNLLFGKNDTDGLSRDAACARYVDGLGVSPEQLGIRIQADADVTLAEGRVVAEMGRQASQSMQPNQDDVVLMESAIADLREARTMYVMSLKLARSRGAPVSNSQIEALSQAYHQTMTDIGKAADVVAQKAADDTSARYAQPANFARQ